MSLKFGFLNFKYEIYKYNIMKMNYEKSLGEYDTYLLMTRLEHLIDVQLTFEELSEYPKVLQSHMLKRIVLQELNNAMVIDPFNNSDAKIKTIQLLNINFVNSIEWEIVLEHLEYHVLEKNTE